MRKCFCRKSYCCNWHTSALCLINSFGFVLNLAFVCPLRICRPQAKTRRQLRDSDIQIAEYPASVPTSTTFFNPTQKNIATGKNL